MMWSQCCRACRKKHGNCSDVRKDCKYWSEEPNSYCTKTYQGFMAANCCNSCKGKGGACKDSNDNCQAAGCNAASWYPDLCKKTCGV